MTLDKLIDEALIDAIPELSIAHLRQHRAQRPDIAQQGMLELLRRTIEQPTPHNVFEDAQSFTCQFIERLLRVEPQRATRIMHDVFESSRGPAGYRRPGPDDDDTGSTLAYWPRPHIMMAAARAYDAAFKCYDRLGHSSRRARQTHTPANGMPSSLGGSTYLPALISLDRGSLDAQIDERIRQYEALERTSASNPDGQATLNRLAADLRFIIGAKCAVLEQNGFPNRYKESASGRLVPDSKPHLISVPKRVRPLLFGGQEAWDYDVQSCMWAIFIALGRRYGFSTEHVSEYVAAKDAYHAYWAGITHHRCPDDFKAIMHAVMMTGRLYWSSESLAGELLGSTWACVLSQDPFMRRLIDEVAIGRSIILESAPVVRAGRQSRIMNAVGKQRACTKRSSGLAHLLFGFEQFAVRAACEGMVALSAIIYDGWIAQEQDTAALEEKIRRRSREQLGFELDLPLKAAPLSLTQPAIASAA